MPETSHGRTRGLTQQELNPHPMIRFSSSFD